MKSESTAHAPGLPWNRYLIFVTLAVGGCALDLLTKHWVFQWRGMPGQRDVWWIWEGYVGIETALNWGAVFGVLQGQVPLFTVLSVIAAIGIVAWLFYGGAARDLLLTIALGSVLGGIFGNLYDRLGLWGGLDGQGQPIRAVRDWILLCYGERFTWPNFNVADSLLVCGALLLAFHAVQQGRIEARQASQRSAVSR